MRSSYYYYSSLNAWNLAAVGAEEEELVHVAEVEHLVRVQPTWMLYVQVEEEHLWQEGQQEVEMPLEGQMLVPSHPFVSVVVRPWQDPSVGPMCQVVHRIVDVQEGEPWNC